MAFVRIIRVLALVAAGLPSVARAGPPLTQYAICAATPRVSIGAGSSVMATPNNPAPIVGSGRAGAVTAVFMNGGAIVQGDVRSAGNVVLQNGNVITGTVYHAAGTTLTHGSPFSIGGEVIGDPELPTLPAASACASGGTSYTLGNGQTLTLAPDSYGFVRMGGACTLNLSSGTYYLGELKTGNGLTLNVDLSGGPLNLFVCAGGGGGGFVDFGSVVMNLVGGAGGNPDIAATMIRLEAQGVSGTGFSFEASGSSTWLGDVFTPNGSIHYGGSGCCSHWIGRLHALGQVDLEHAVTGELAPTPAKNSTWGQVKATYR
jgi:hypothetical protein